MKICIKNQRISDFEITKFDLNLDVLKIPTGLLIKN